MSDRFTKTRALLLRMAAAADASLLCDPCPDMKWEAKASHLRDLAGPEPAWDCPEAPEPGSVGWVLDKEGTTYRCLWSMHTTITGCRFGRMSDPFSTGDLRAHGLRWSSSLICPSIPVWRDGDACEVRLGGVWVPGVVTAGASMFARVEAPVGHASWPITRGADWLRRPVAP